MKTRDDKQTSVTLSGADLERLIGLQDHCKRILSRLRIKAKSSIHIGEPYTLDIDKNSKINLANVKKRLRDGALLPPAEQKQITSEKKHSTDILTPCERRLFLALVTRPFVISHSTSTRLMPEIEEQKALLDSKELERRGITPRKATPAFCGIEQNIFFGFGTRYSSVPFFVRSRNNRDTNKREDFSTLQIDFSYITAHPQLLKFLWSSSHIFRYQTGIAIPRSELLHIGDSKVYWLYEIIHAFETQKRKHIKHFHFKRKDGIEIKQSLGIDDEIAAGADFLPFFAHLFIERLRYIGGSMREYLLLHPDDGAMIDLLVEKLFPVFDFEVHLPVKVPLDEKYFEVITPQKRKQITEKVSNAAKLGNIKELAALKQQGYPFEGYMYEDPYSYDNSPATPLPLIAALKANQQKTVQWLVENGVNHTAFLPSYRDPLDRGQTRNIDNLIVSIFEAVFESANLTTLNYLIASGLDVNAIHKRIEIQLSELEIKYYDLKYRFEHSDTIMTKAIHAVAKHGKMAILKRIVELSDYCKDIAILDARILKDNACVGSGKTYKYFLKKFPQVNAKRYDKYELSDLVRKHNNVLILPYFCEGKDWARWAVEHTLEQGSFESGLWLLKKTGMKILRDDFSRDFGAFGLLKEAIPDTQKFIQRVEWVKKHTNYEFNISLSVGGVGSLLSVALNQCQFAVAKILLDIDHRWMDPYALRRALDEEQTEFADYLLTIQKTSLDDNRLSQYFYDNLLKTIEFKHKKSVQWLLAKGVEYETDEIRKTILAFATPDIAVLMISHFKENIPREQSAELYRGAIDGGNIAMLSWLRSRYPFYPDDHLDDFLGCTHRYRLNAAETMHWLMAQGVRVAALDNNDIKMAAKDIMTNIMYPYLSEGKSLEEICSGPTLRLFSALFPQETREVVASYPGMLIKVINKANKDRSGCDIADYIEWLISAGHEISQPIQSGLTTITHLAVACEQGQIVTVKGLLEAGADPNIYYGNRVLVLQQANLYQGKFRQEIIDMLMAHGARLSLEEDEKKSNNNNQHINISSDIRNNAFAVTINGSQSLTANPSNESKKSNDKKHFSFFNFFKKPHPLPPLSDEIRHSKEFLL